MSYKFNRGFPPLHPKSPSLEIGDEEYIKLSPTGKPRLRQLRWQGRGVTGFTLIELIVVVVIIGALSAMVLPRLTGRTDQARKAAALADIQANIATALKLYELDNGSFPTTEQGLAALLAKPSGDPVPQQWNGPYLDRKPVDPWGNPYVYSSPGEHRPDYDLYSLGKDAKVSNDDINNWQ